MARRWNRGFISSSSQSTGFATLTGISKLGTSLRLNMVPSGGGGGAAEGAFYQDYYIPGTYSFSIPAGVTSVSILAIGAGGQGDDGNVGDGGGGGGAGGASAYVNELPVSGGSISIVVGDKGATNNAKGTQAASGESSVVTYGTFVMTATGGTGGSPYSSDPGASPVTPSFSNIPAGALVGGHRGGGGGRGYNGGGGGGGAGGVGGRGGHGGGAINGVTYTTDFDGGGYAGGGGAGYDLTGGTSALSGGSGGDGQSDVTGGGGGGAYTFSSTYSTTDGGDGNGVTSAGGAGGSYGGDGGFPGGGGGGSWDNNYGIEADGGTGFVRIVWGTKRGFPYNAEDTNDIDTEYFPPAYRDVITSSIAATNYTYYVDATNGSDTNNGTSLATAFASIDKLNTVMNALTTSTVTAIVYPGEYTITPFAGWFYSSGSYATVPFKDFGYARKIICAPGKVDFIWTAGAQRDAPLVDFGSTSSAVYGAIFKRNNNNRTTNYTVAFHGGITAAGNHQLYNCVIQETNANGNWSLQYDNNNNSVGKWYNCTVAVNEIGANDYSGSTGFVSTDVVFNYTYGTGNASKVDSEILASNNLNFTTYRGTDSNADGVYHGTYAWPAHIASWRTANR